jgi:predicted ATP-binding protein involved in virulence
VAELSDGYKALIGMAVDIMDVMHQAQYDDMKDAKGIVLIDELGNHFHPEWKIRIVSALRRTFPAIQFIFSTHEPLCLRGLVDGEVAVLQQDKQGVFLLTDLPELQNLRIDQLLTSEHFGLASTLDPAENQKIQRYHFLLRNTERNEEETFELSELERELSDSRYLGGSRRERMLLQLLDLSLETPLRQPGQNVSVEKLSSRSLNRLKEILRVIDNGASGAAEVGGT